MYDEINIKESSINQKSNNIMLLMPCTGATFAKKISCLVTRIVSFDSASLYVLTFRTLEPHPPNDIDLDLSHVISH